MAVFSQIGYCQGRGDADIMTGTVERFDVTHEQAGTLGSTEEERYIKRAMQATASTAFAVLTLGIAKGWKFNCRPGNVVAMWIPASGATATTYDTKNAALWRAIKKRDESLT